MQLVESDSLTSDNSAKLQSSKQYGTGTNMGFSSGSGSKESACSAGDLGSISGFGRSPGEGNGYPIQYSCLENSIDRGSWQATVHGVAKSWTWLRDFHSLTNRHKHRNIDQWNRIKSPQNKPTQLWSIYDKGD